MILILESSRSEINEAYLGIQEHLALNGLPTDIFRGRRYLPVVCESLIRIVAEKNILRLQISMDEIQVMQD